jgi:hypothetical protein
VVARKDEYRYRFKVERSFAELSQFPQALDAVGASGQRLLQFFCGWRHAPVRAPPVRWTGSSAHDVLASVTGDMPSWWTGTVERALTERRSRVCPAWSGTSVKEVG